jgi:cytochrome bd-type quinol oxidase subunit 2
MLNILIVAVMVAILASLAGALYFLVRDRGETRRTVVSLSLRVAFAVLLLVLLALGFLSRYPAGG